jgi:hypothetical protein
VCLSDLTPWPPSLRGKGENLAGLSPLRLGKGQNSGEPSAYESGQSGGSRGAKPHGGGPWGMCPQKFKRGGESPPLATSPRVGPKTPANPKPTGVGKTGVQGAKPPGRGSWGVSPPFKRGGDADIRSRHEWDPKGRPAPTLIKAGVEGAQAPSQGVWGMCPQNSKEGASRPH